jgi:hypothetical protein
LNRQRKNQRSLNRHHHRRCPPGRCKPAVFSVGVWRVIEVLSLNKEKFNILIGFLIRFEWGSSLSPLGLFTIPCSVGGVGSE